MKIYLHFKPRNKPNNQLETFKVEIQESEIVSLEEFTKFTFLKHNKITNYDTVEIFNGYGTISLKNKQMLLSSYFSENDDLIFEYDEIDHKVAPIKEEAKITEEKFETISKYTFYESDDELWVKVIIELKGVHKLPKENISARFLEKSFEIIFRNLNGENWKFGVPILQCKIIGNESKYFLKTDKIIISLKKLKKDDRWISLFKTKTIGGDDD